MTLRTALAGVGRLALGAGLVLGLLGVQAPPAAAAVPAIDAIGILAPGTQMARLSTSSTTISVSAVKTITGLQSGENILGIDVRPTTGQLFGLGSTSQLYIINPVTAAATAVGSPFSPALSGSSFGFDFNPVVDRIRVTSNTGQNLRLNPVTGAVVATDGALNGAATGLDGSAYTSSAGVATATTLYGIEASSGNLYIQNPPNAGTLTTVGSLGLSGLAANVGFDILTTSSGSSVVNRGVASLIVGGTAGLYEIDLATGAATLIGTTALALNGLALTGPTGYCGSDITAKVVCVGGAGGARGPIAGLRAAVVDAAQTPSGQGVWQVALDGGVFNSGDAGFFGSAGAVPLNMPVVGIAGTPTGLGYWLVGADGGVFNYGDAGFFGSVPGVLGGAPLNSPVVGIAGTGTGKGYWIVAEDGGVFAFGDATFFGSVPAVLAPGQTLNAPVVGVARNEAGPGYYMVALDGGVFNFGAPFHGSAASLPLAAPIFDIASAGATGGYRLLGADGGIFTYGGAGFSGAVPTGSPVIGLAG